MKFSCPSVCPWIQLCLELPLLNHSPFCDQNLLYDNVLVGGVWSQSVIAVVHMCVCVYIYKNVPVHNFFFFFFFWVAKFRKQVYVFRKFKDNTQGSIKRLTKNPRTNTFISFLSQTVKSLPNQPNQLNKTNEIKESIREKARQGNDYILCLLSTCLKMAIRFFHTSPNLKIYITEIYVKKTIQIINNLES